MQRMRTQIQFVADMRPEVKSMDMRGATTAWAVPQPMTSGRLPYAALAGVRRRRFFAMLVDMFLVGLLSFAIVACLAIVTFGLSLLILPPLLPAVAFFYNGLTISGARMATPGMRAFDLEARLTDGGRAPFLNAAVQAVLFYLSWSFPPIFLFSLFQPEKRCLHDIFSGMIVTRTAD